MKKKLELIAAPTSMQPGGYVPAAYAYLSSVRSGCVHRDAGTVEPNLAKLAEGADLGLAGGWVDDNSGVVRSVVPQRSILPSPVRR